ncbi:Protein lap4 [Eumeta japonica]|uniref:Protein lap4 n=1 Tax=Eumeta variegata TaxID=151549 RepID=A0A4C1UIV3_EUMVA|nr:Protein lap4 [Eumeta japonica]
MERERCGLKEDVVTRIERAQTPPTRPVSAEIKEPIINLQNTNVTPNLKPTTIQANHVPASAQNIPRVLNQTFNVQTQKQTPPQTFVQPNVVPPQPAPRKLSQPNGQPHPQSKSTSNSTSTPLTPGANTHGSSDDVFADDIQPSRPITNEEFQAMIPAHFLSGTRPASDAPPPEGGVRVTVERPGAGALLPPPPLAPGRVTETITKSTFTETTVTRITDNQLVAPLIIEDVTLVKENGSLGFSIIGGTDHSCVPFGGKEPGIFVSHVVAGGVASRSGKLRMGDRILKVNGTDLSGATHREAVQLLLQPGPTLNLNVRHDPLPPGYQELTIIKQEGEKLGMHIKGGLKGQRGNPNDPNDEGVFISKINSGGAARRDGRLKVGMRLLEVNGTSLLGATHAEAVNALRRATFAPLNLVVCHGYTRPDKYTTGSESGTADTGGSLSHSTSSLDRDDSLHQYQQEQQFQQELIEFEHEKQVAEMREKSTPEKVLDIVHAVESIALEPAPPTSPEPHHKTTTVVMSKHTLQPQSSGPQASHPSPLVVFSHQRTGSASGPSTTPSPGPADYGTSVDPESTRPTSPPPAPPAPPSPSILPAASTKQKPQVPRKPTPKRVSFINDTTRDFEQPSTNDRLAGVEPAPVPSPPLSHDGLHERPAALTLPRDKHTNRTSPGEATIVLIRGERDTTPTFAEPAYKQNNVISDDVIIPPPPFFDADVSFHRDNYVNIRPLSPLNVSTSDTKDMYEDPGILPITVVPEHKVLPEPIIAETTMQSSDFTNSPETEAPPPINYNTLPASSPESLLSKSPRSPILAYVPSQQFFRSTHLSSGSSEYYPELDHSPGREPDPPELLQVHYSNLPTVSHIPNVPCNLHPDETFSSNYFPSYYSYSDIQNIDRDEYPTMIHSATYPAFDPYPSLTTVAGTYNPYSYGHSPSAQSKHSTKSPTTVTAVLKDINENVTETVPRKSVDLPPKAINLDKRVHFGEVITVPEPMVPDYELGVAEEEPALKSEPRPKWSSTIKAFAIGEVSPPHSGNLVKASVSDKKKFFENAMEESHKPSPKPADEVEKLKQEEERKMASMSAGEVAYDSESSHSDDEPHQNGHGAPAGGVGPSAKARRRRAARGQPDEDTEEQAARRAAWRAARLRSLEQDALQTQMAIKSMVGPVNDIPKKQRDHSPSEKWPLPRIALRTKPGPILAVKEKEKLLDERITLRAEEYVCPTTGETKVRTVEYIEKLIEKEVETTQEKIISLELTTSPVTENPPTEPGLIVPDEDTSLQPDIVQVVNPLLDGNAGRVTAIPVGPAQRITTYTEHEDSH